MLPPAAPRKTVAVIGSGVSGLLSAAGLQDHAEVQVYEALGRFGGHILPVEVTDSTGRSHRVDTALAIFVRDAYPRMVRLLERLGVSYGPADARFHVYDQARQVSFWPGELLAQFGRGLAAECRRDFVDFGVSMARVRRQGVQEVENVRFGDWLDAKGYHPDFRELGILPWVSAFWGLQPEQILEVSATLVLREIARNAGPVEVLRVLPSTGAYLDALLALVPERARVREAVLAVEVEEGAPLVRTASGLRRYDHVVIATSAEQALALLPRPTERTRRVLSAFRYQPTTAVLHRERALLPADRARWVTFHHARLTGPERPRSITTWRLDAFHALLVEEPILLTTGDEALPECGLIPRPVEVFRHRHNVLTPEAVRAMSELETLDQGEPWTLAGAYFSLGGLHEDAIRSAERAVAKVRRALQP